MKACHGYMVQPLYWSGEFGLSFMGFGACLLFAREAQRSGSIPGCGRESPCEAVSASRWARVGSVPVANFGLGLYSLCICAILARLWGPFEPLARNAQAILLLLAVGAALWFTFLQALVIRRICRFCMFLHGVSIALGLLTWREGLAVEPLGIGIGSAGILGLILAQLFVPGKTYFVTHMTNAVPAVAAGKNTDSNANNINPVQPCTTRSPDHIELLGGRVVLAHDEWPTLGNPQASSRLALLFDVTCTECRALYRLLQAVIAKHPGEFLVLTIPVPLDPACNNSVPKAAPASIDACELTRLFLAAKSDPAIFEDFSRWLLATKNCPPVSEARRRLQQQLGSRLALATVGGAIDTQIQNSIGLFQHSPSDKLPQLLFSDRLVVGHIASVEDFLKIFAS